MFEKVTTSARADRGPYVQAQAISASLATHALCALGIAAIPLGAAAVRAPEEVATYFLLYHPAKPTDVPAALPAHRVPRRSPAVAGGLLRAGMPDRRQGAPYRAIERVLRAPLVTGGIVPLTGTPLDPARQRGVGDLGTEPISGQGDAAELAAGGGGAPVVDAETFAVPPRIVNRREISALLSRLYPLRLKFRGIQGEVLVAFIIGVDGRAEMESVQVLSASNPGFVRSALEGLKRMRFRPAELDGTRVRVRASLPIAWVLAENG